MKILSVTAQKPDSTGSGVYLSALVEQWNRMGHRQAVVAGVTGADRPVLPEGVRLYPVAFSCEELPFPVVGMSDEMPYPSTRYRDMTEAMTEQFTRAFTAVLDRAVAELDPDVIVCHHLYLLTALVRRRYPERTVLGICHGSDLRQFQKNPLWREQIRKEIAALDGIIALQEAQREDILRLFSCSGERLEVIGAGYAPEIFHSEGRLPGRSRKVAFAGKISEKKGVGSLLRALEQMPRSAQPRAVVLAGGHGGGEEFLTLQRQATACPCCVELPGPLPQRELAELLRSCDVFVLPSFFEGLPLVTLEAMACGCRVVCSDLPGLRAWFDRWVPGHQVLFVSLPEMERSDEPRPEDLPAFEGRLASALALALERGPVQPPDLSAVTWRGTAGRILAAAEAAAARRSARDETETV